MFGKKKPSKMSDFTLSVPEDTNHDRIDFVMQLRYYAYGAPEDFLNLIVHERDDIRWYLKILRADAHAVIAKLFVRLSGNEVRGFFTDVPYDVNFEVTLRSYLDDTVYPVSSQHPEDDYSTLRNIRVLASELLKATTDAIELLEPKLLRATEVLN